MRELEPYRLHVFCCTNDRKEVHCGNKGGHEVYETFRREVEARGLKDVKVTRMGCNHLHHVGPILVIYPEGIWYREVKPEDIPEIIEKHLIEGQVVERLLHYKMPTGCEQGET